MKSFEFESCVRVSPREAWEAVVTPKGVNAEFWPFLRMTFPRAVGDLVAGWRANETLFRLIGVSKTYHTGEVDVPVLHDVNLEIAAGAITVMTPVLLIPPLVIAWLLPGTAQRELEDVSPER